jgi:hypothetical protein
MVKRKTRRREPAGSSALLGCGGFGSVGRGAAHQFEIGIEA